MANFFQKAGKYIAEKVFKNIESGSGNMILITSMTGIAFSCIAQTFAIFINKKYSVSQKAFMVPQELTEGVISIASMFAISKPCQKAASKIMKSGKIFTKDMATYMKKYDLIGKRGEYDFDFQKSVKSIISKIENSDEFIKSNACKQEEFLAEHHNIIKEFNAVSDATSAFATTAGSIMSTALISPLLRNYVASYYQQVNLNYYNKLPQERKNSFIDYKKYSFLNPSCYSGRVNKI